MQPRGKFGAGELQIFNIRVPSCDIRTIFVPLPSDYILTGKLDL